MVQYRKSKKVGPFRVTVSGSGVSYSVGGPGYRVTRRADGRVQRTVSIPGAGIRDTKIIGGGQRRALAASAQPAQPDSIAVQALTLALLSVVLFLVGGFILSVIAHSVAVGFGVVGGLLLSVWIGLGIYVVTLIVRRHQASTISLPKAAEPTAVPSTPSSKIRCVRCKHVQAAPPSESSFVCDQCGTSLKRVVKQPS